jgi:hypothetical protein
MIFAWVATASVTSAPNEIVATRAEAAVLLLTDTMFAVGVIAIAAHAFDQSLDGAVVAACGIGLGFGWLGWRVRRRVPPPARWTSERYWFDIGLGHQWLRPRVIGRALALLRGRS